MGTVKAFKMELTMFCNEAESGSTTDGAESGSTTDGAEPINSVEGMEPN